MVVSETIELETRGHAHMIDITAAVAEKVEASGLRSGTATVFCPGSTGAVTTIEYESGALSDLQRLFDEIVPPDRDYAHNLRWGDGNGHSHVRAALLGPSLAVPFAERRLLLGTWQQITFIDFDNRPRSRRLVLQIIGE
ncbi:MAG: YjbQ family protein [Gemmatimonadetes bacterium]|uniref:YjbQ family protein n=1 Tax=Candidatus Kutchimonas denitrificans TaxID=3056748 RepID=A0AAE4ZC09_9BACT|nr:YjbQ family protein [Gemmatimonadota bacterium]NIR76657.1 YjbQ family protein [Candidatus Kutchimonas denitrificans]NIS02406.1 YjbQ family protein [Gemmatimonadota bacterium]NIT68310.1 YjbQ family protein [Gemmatimonadota bacterium]NIU54777.1 YjbQ family protein [Gemmatimonadota bacterium]